MKKILTGLLIISCLAFAADLFHMTYHLTKDSSLWNVSGVPLKYAVKVMMILIPFTLLIFRKAWLRFLLLVLVFTASHSPYGWTFWSSGCERAREMLEKSGAARDAKENFLGRIKVQPPHGSFPQEMDKISWWGKFKPFEFWQSPNFHAAWIDPEGNEVMRREFKGEHCALAKTTIQGDEQPKGQFKPGIWKVIVTCDDYLVDRQTFAVVPSGASPPLAGESGKASQDSMMIWAKDKV